MGWCIATTGFVLHLDHDRETSGRYLVIVEVEVVVEVESSEPLDLETLVGNQRLDLDSHDRSLVALADGYQQLKHLMASWSARIERLEERLEALECRVTIDRQFPASIADTGRTATARKRLYSGSPQDA